MSEESVSIILEAGFITNLVALIFAAIALRIASQNRGLFSKVGAAISSVVIACILGTSVGVYDFLAGHIPQFADQLLDGNDLRRQLEATRDLADSFALLMCTQTFISCRVKK